MSEIVDRIQAREILLGVQFQPKREDIDTPQILLDAGFPANSLRLVGFPATEAMQVRAAAKGDDTTYAGLCVCHCLYWRADDQPVLNMTDIQVLISQDIELLNTLAAIVFPFLGIGQSATGKAVTNEAVETAKNDSEATQKSDGGTGSPTISDFTLPEPASEPSSTAIS